MGCIRRDKWIRDEMYVGGRGECVCEAMSDNHSPHFLPPFFVVFPPTIKVIICGVCVIFPPQKYLYGFRWSIKALSRLNQGSVKHLLTLYSIKALLRLY
jgi:hypothetical protein